jgi:hypothetical protein
MLRASGRGLQTLQRIAAHIIRTVELVRDLVLIASGLMLAGYVVFAWRRARERRRRWRQDLCPACGYDVRASTEKCPECGTPIWRFPRDSATFVIPDERSRGE